jgi:outer membrane protein OmpA-like peptidoglycan-associated protein
MAEARRKARKVTMLAALAVVMLGGCSSLNPINWYRDATGASKNDDADASSRNKENLEAGGEQPYPTIGSVPPPPETALSTVDRKNLEKGLIADRANARYSDDELRQGHSVPPLPGEPPPAVQDTAPAAATVPPSDGAPSAAAAAAPRHNPPVRGSEQAPQESSLTTPAVHSLPQGEAPHRPPPPPRGVASEAARSAQKEAPVAPQPQSALAPPRPATANAVTAALPPAAMRGNGAAVTLAAAEIGFAADGSLSSDDRKRLADVAEMAKDGDAKVRIIGYGRQGRGPDAVQQELASFDAALDRANAAAQALAKLGVPASRITVQVAPELRDGGLAAGRAEVLIEY